MDASVSHTPEHAIRQWLAHVNLKAADGKSLPFQVLTDTIRFVKKRGAPHRQLWYVTCDAEGAMGAEQWQWTVLVSRQGSGRWTAHGVSGGDGAGAQPARGSPWANLGGGWGQDGFQAGGTVEGTGVSRVRLTDSEETTFEDSVDDGVVLFLSDKPIAMPMRVELFDSDGRVVATDEWGFVDE
jgi:hypothetical protein